MEVKDDALDRENTDLKQQMVAAGSVHAAASRDTSLRLKGETAFTWADVDRSGTIKSMDLNTSRQRLMMEGTHVQKLASGATVAPSIELGVRHDGGDGETGNSIETAGALRYVNPATGLVIEGKVRTVVEHSEDYNEWGVSGTVQFDPGVAGMGLALHLKSSLGHSANSGVQQMWETVDAGRTLLSRSSVERLKARISYGSRWGEEVGILTPYTDLTLSGDGYRRLSVGGRYELDSALTMNLEGVYSQPVYAEPIHSILLRGNLRW